MKKALLKHLLLLVGTAALMAGCASEGSGGMGNDSQGIYAPDIHRDPAPTASGVISPSNPFGLDSSTGMTSRH